MKPKTIDRVKTGRLSTMLSWACWQGLEVGNIASRESTPEARGRLQNTNDLPWYLLWMYQACTVRRRLTFDSWSSCNNFVKNPGIKAR